MAGERLRVLHLSASLVVTNTEYNEHCLPMRYERDISICSFSLAEVQIPPEIVLFEGDGTYRGFWRTLRRALAAGPYDIVHVHTPRTAVPLIAMSLLRRRSMAGTVATLHNSWENFKPTARPILFVIAATFAAVVACGRSAAATMPSALRRLAGRRFQVVQNGTDTERIAAALAGMPPAERRDDRFTVTWVGRMLPRKDPSTLLDAAELLGEDVEIVFIGDGEERAPLARDVARRGLGHRVRVVGLLEREEVYREIARSDLYVSTSKGEGLPVAVLEAMACGTPVLLSDIPPHREIEGAEIPFVPVGDAAAFAKAIDRFRSMPLEERRALGRRGRAVVEAGFSLASMHQGYDRVYAAVRSAARR